MPNRSRSARLSLLVLATLGWTGAAEAADVPGNRTTRATLRVTDNTLAFTTGALEIPNDSDWYRVSLTRGRDYYISAIVLDEEVGLGAYIRDARGRVLASLRFADPLADDGFEFRAPASGTYFLEYRATGGASGLGYRARIAGDCRNGVTTLCPLQPGQIRRNAILGSANDTDWFRMSLSASRTYTLAATPREGCTSDFTVRVADSRGRPLRSGQPSHSVDEASVLADYRPPSSGTYFAIVDVLDDCGVRYDLMLGTP